MANLSVSSDNVVASSSAWQVIGVAGVTITAGQLLYLDIDGTYKLAIATTLAEADFKGVALCNSSPGQPVVLARYDSDLDIGNASLDKGEIYCVSATVAGAVAPVSDLIAGDYVTIVGIANGRRSLHITNETGTRSTAAKA